MKAGYDNQGYKL